MGGIVDKAVFEGNLEALSRADPGTASIVSQAGAWPEKAAVGRSRRGIPFVLEKSGKEVLPLEDPTDPAAAAKKAVSEIPKDARLVTAVGIGSGCQLKALRGRKELDEILVVEFDPAALKMALDISDLRGVIGDPRFRFIVGEDPEAIVEGLKKRHDHGTERGRLMPVLPPTRLLIHPAARRWNPSETKQLEEGMTLLERTSGRNRRTLRLFCHTWRRNILLNMGIIAHSPGVMEMEGRGSGFGGILVGAGPSLDRSVEVLARWKGRAIITAVDSAARTLINAGIRPDIVVALDANPGIESYLLDLDLSETVLMMIPVVSPGVPRLFERHIIASYGHPLQAWTERRLGKFGSLLVSGSVATVGYDLLRLLGARPIILLGMDLALTGGRSHTMGALEGMNRMMDRFRTFETIDRRLFPPPRNIVPLTSGGKAGATDAMMRWREWFESEQRRRRYPTINATALGARIEGIESMPLEEALERMPGPAAARRRPLESVRGGARRGIGRLKADLEALGREARGGGGEATERILDWELAALGREGYEEALLSLPDEIEEAVRGL